MAGHVIRLLALSVLVTTSITNAGASDIDNGPAYSPYANQEYPENVYWGDTHLHTNLSADAYGMRNALTPEDAYRFAKGNTVVSNSNQPARLSRPLDFLLIADHAEYLGVSAMLDSQADQLANSEIGRRWLALKKQDNLVEIMLDSHKASMGVRNTPHDIDVSRRVWNKVAQAADRHNEPGKFTAFIGYEWSALPQGNNLHRNVLFRDGADLTGRFLPFSALDSRNPEDLWHFLQEYEKQTGGQVLAIPHNGNMSNGLMFSNNTLDGSPLTNAYAETRARWEPVMEVTQIKGDSEAHPYLSPNDEFADFETWDARNFAMPPVPKQPQMLQYEYARSALQKGLSHEAALGANPFKFGMIGSTDSHVALSAVEENNYFGKFGVDEPSADRAHSDVMPASKYAASGYAAVWASENTREALFDAIRRREVYATSGPRIVLRFFGGWDFQVDDHLRADFAKIGYRKGVPMGSDLGRADKGRAPAFLVMASKDPIGANLDRVQIVKGWLDNDGNSYEKVFDVALSDNRRVNSKTGKAPSLISTVDASTATYVNSIGDVQLATVWLDPQFDAEQSAFYYLRVLEIPTPRWTTYDAAFYGSKLPQQAPIEIQERAYSSPIWYSPG